MVSEEEDSGISAIAVQCAPTSYVTTIQMLHMLEEGFHHETEVQLYPTLSIGVEIVLWGGAEGLYLLHLLCLARPWVQFST